MPDRNVEALLAYLRQNSGRFTLEALELQMHAAGHKPATVRAALERFLAQQGTRAATGPELEAPPAQVDPVAPIAPAAPSAPLQPLAPVSSLDPRAPVDPMSATGSYVGPRIELPNGRRPVWGAALGVAAFDLVLAGAGGGLVKAGEGKVAFLGGCVAALAPLALLLELLVGLILTAADGASRAGRAMLYGSLLVLGFAALTLVTVGIYLAATAK
jgi:hypothetical protein